MCRSLSGYGNGNFGNGIFHRLPDEGDREGDGFHGSIGGGVTFCGGEPLLHPDMLLELLHRCGELGIHRVIDTTLYAKPDVVQKVMEHTELFLVDLKHMDSIKHKIYCGVPNELILSNLRMIADAGHEFYIRIPLIEGVNADEKI